MRKKLLLLSLCWTTLSLWGAIPGLAACSISVSYSGSGSYPAGTGVILTAVPSGCGAISQVAFYNGATLLGTVTTSPYIFTWNTTSVPSGTYTNINAVASFAGGIGAGTSTLIDIVGAANPVLDPSFGYSGSGSWLPGDSQLHVWPPGPTNGSGSNSLEDGTCAWNDTGGPPPGSPPPTANSTIDSLDDTVHMLSDFVVFANSLLNKSVWTLSSTFQTWYPQAQVWITPTCNDGSVCTNFQCADGTGCNRLASVVNNLNAWGPVITSWLSNNYASPTAWCVPPGTTGSANEDAFINASGGVWGSLPSCYCLR